MAQPLKVTCPSCTSKFHIPLHLVRGKVVSFRCKKCKGTIPVDGRAITSLTPIALQAPTIPPPETVSPRDAFYSEPPGRLSLSDGIVVQDGLPNTTGLHADTPSAFTHANPSRNTPPLLARTPPTGVTPALLISTPPTTLSKTTPPPPLHNTYPPVSFRPSNGGKKVVVAAALVAAASLTLWSMSRAPHRAASLASAAPPTQTSAARATDEPARPPTPAVTAEPIHAVNPANLPIAKDEPAPRTATAAHHPAKGRPARADNADTAADEPAAQAPVAAAPAAPAAPADDTSTNEVEFNREAARLALEDAGQKAASCRTIDTPAGPARVAVTFAPGGNVTAAVIESGPLVGTSAGGCLASKVRSAKVPAFTGDPITVHKMIVF
jgi:predicted Zn finger-like uncharacterized protein